MLQARMPKSLWVKLALTRFILDIAKESEEKTFLVYPLSRLVWAKFGFPSVLHSPSDAAELASNCMALLKSLKQFKEIRLPHTMAYEYVG